MHGFADCRPDRDDDGNRCLGQPATSASEHQGMATVANTLEANIIAFGTVVWSGSARLWVPLPSWATCGLLLSPHGDRQGQFGILDA